MVAEGQEVKVPERAGRVPLASCSSVRPQASASEFWRLCCLVSLFGPWCWRAEVEVGVCKGEIDAAAGWEE